MLKRFISTICVSLLVLSGCTKQSATEQQSSLDPLMTDAVELAILTLATNASLNPVDIDPDLRARLQKYTSNTEMQSEVRNVQATFKDGVHVKVTPVGVAKYKFKGAINAEITIVDGEVGLTAAGKIFISDGAILEINQGRYMFAGASWKPS